MRSPGWGRPHGVPTRSSDRVGCTKGARRVLVPLQNETTHVAPKPALPQGQPLLHRPTPGAPLAARIEPIRTHKPRSIHGCLVRKLAPNLSQRSIRHRPRQPSVPQHPHHVQTLPHDHPIAQGKTASTNIVHPILQSHPPGNPPSGCVFNARSFFLSLPDRVEMRLEEAPPCVGRRSAKVARRGTSGSHG